MSAARRAIDAVLFDLSGVLIESAFTHLGSVGDDGQDADAVLELLLGPYHEDTDHPWHRCERGEISVVDCIRDLKALAEAAEMSLDFGRLAGMLGRLEVHDVVLERVRQLRADGYRTALVTNNVREASSEWRSMIPVDDLFDVVVDSSDVGMRKPNPAIYRHTLKLLGSVPPERAVFLDDSLGNVDGARRVGMHGILVGDPVEAISELDALLADGLDPPVNIG